MIVRLYQSQQPGKFVKSKAKKQELPAFLSL